MQPPRPPHPVPAVAAGIFARQCGLARRSQLREVGITSDHVDAHVRAGRWRAVAPTVVAADNGRLDRDQLLWLAGLHGTCSRIAGRTALERRGFEGSSRSTVHVLAPRDHRPTRLAGVTIHVSDRLPEDLPDLERGLPVCEVPRATIDAAAWDPHPRLAAGLVLAVVQQGLATPEQLLAELELAGRVRNRAVVRRALEDALGGADSLAEVDVEPLIRRAGMVVARRQVRRGGRRHDIEIDLPDGTVLVVEVDGAQHDTAQARWADAARDAALVAEGRLLLRIPTYAVRYEPAGVVARLRAVHEAALRRARAGHRRV